ncbi:MAG: DUF480 domain-containing protein [Planctomycetota bacterium]
MIPNLDPLEARILGVLIEKELATPDQSPLSMNTLLAGCNQKSNRDPVMMVSEAEARLTLDGLQQKHLASVHHPASGRVERFGPSARETLSLMGGELAVLAELLLRGPQQRGELRTRASRMVTIASLPELAETLTALTRKGLVTELSPAAGTRAPRFAQLLCPPNEPAAPAPAPTPAAPSAPADPAARFEPKPRPVDLGEKVAELESEVARLRRGLESLAAKLGESLED